VEALARPLARLSRALGKIGSSARLQSRPRRGCHPAHVHDLIDYLQADRHALVNYGRRRHEGLPISTAFVESAVNEILSKRMIKQQQMRW
jgi:hypothetical protein